MSKSDNIGFESLQKLVEINKCKSPNNIRRIIISPEGVCVYYYVNVPTACKQFSVLDYRQSIKDPKVKLMLQNLYTGAQITSIEEIIVLTTSMSGNEELSPNEYSPSTIINRRGVQSLDGCKNAYKRLRYITVIRGIPFAKFLQAIGKEKNIDFISEIPDIQNYAEITEINGKDYYTKNGISIASRTAYPNYDGQGGVLVKYFSAIKAKKDAQIKREFIENERKEKYAELYNTFNKNFNMYEYYFTGCVRIYNIINKQGLNAYSQLSSSIKPIKVTLYKVDGIKESKSYNLNMDKIEEETALKENIKILNDAIVTIYLDVVKELYNQVISLSNAKPITARILMDSCDCVVAPKGKNLNALNDEIQSKLGKSFTGVSMRDSFANACAYLCKYFVSDPNNEISVYCEKSKWMEAKR